MISEKINKCNKSVTDLQHSLIHPDRPDSSENLPSQRIAHLYCLYYFKRQNASQLSSAQWLESDRETMAEALLI